MIRRLAFLGAFAASVVAQIPTGGGGPPLWAVGTVEIVCDGPFVLRMRGGFPWNGTYQPVGSPYSGDYGAKISVVGMAEGRDDPPYSQSSPMALTVEPFGPSFKDVRCDADGDKDVDMWDNAFCTSIMTGPQVPVVEAAVLDVEDQ